MSTKVLLEVDAQRSPYRLRKKRTALADGSPVMILRKLEIASSSVGTAFSAASMIFFDIASRPSPPAIIHQLPLTIFDFLNDHPTFFNGPTCSLGRSGSCG
jgi:hypothetical protein